MLISCLIFARWVCCGACSAPKSERAIQDTTEKRLLGKKGLHRIDNAGQSTVNDDEELEDEDVELAAGAERADDPPGLEDPD
eukprot:8173057-Pyramimonas_sp.AAC.1